MSEDDNIEEKCSICGKILEKDDGRFRMVDQVLCIDCYYKRDPPATTKDKNDEFITINRD